MWVKRSARSREKAEDVWKDVQEDFGQSTDMVEILYREGMITDEEKRGIGFAALGVSSVGRDLTADLACDSTAVFSPSTLPLSIQASNFIGLSITFIAAWGKMILCGYVYFRGLTYVKPL
jgi:hypothetical protein